MTIVLRSAEPIGASSELLLLVMRACTEINQGYASASPVTPNWYDKALVAVHISNEDDETIVGFLTYDERYEGSQYHIQLGYVMPEHRGQGIYRRLWEELVDRANADTNIVRITRSTHVKNTRMRKVAEQQGCEASVITYGYTVRPNNIRPIEPNKVRKF